MSVLRRFRLPITLAVLGLLGWGAVHLLTSEQSLRIMADRVRVQLEEDLGLTLEVGTLHAEPESARFSVSPVILKDTEGEIIFQAQRVTVEVAPLPIFARRVELRSLEIVEPKLHLRIRDGAIVGLKARKGKGGERSSLRVDANNMRVTGGRVIVEVDDKLVAKLTGIRARLKTSGEDAHTLKFHVEDSEVVRHLERGDDVIQTSAFNGRLAVFGDGLFAPDRVTVSDITLASDKAQVSVAGNILLGDMRLVPAFDLDVTAVASLPDIVRHVTPDVEVGGAASVAARISGAYGGKDLRATGQADVTDLFINGFGLGTLRARFEVDPEELRVPALAVHAAGTVVNGEMAVRFDDTLSFDARARGENYLLYELLAQLKKPGAWTSLTVDGEVIGGGTLKPLKFAGKYRGELRDFRLATSDVMRVTNDDDLLLRTVAPFDANFDVEIDTERFHVAGTVDDGLTNAEGALDLFFDTSRGFKLEARSERADWASVGNRLARMEYTGVGAASTTMGGPYSDVIIEADAWLRGFSLSGFDFGDLDGKVHYRNRVLSFNEVTATKNNSVYSGDVILTFGKEVSLRSVPEDPASDPRVAQGLYIDVDVDVTDAQAEDLRAVVPARYDSGVLGFVRELEFNGPIRGPLKASGYIGDATVDFLIGEGDLEFGNGASLLGQTLAGGRGKMILDADKFFVDGLNLEVAGGRAFIDATVDRWSADLTGRFQLDDLNLSGVDAIQGTERVFTGTASAEGELGRVASNPGFTGTGKIRGAAWGEIPIGDADLNLSHRDRSLTAAGPMLSGRGTGEVVVETRAPYPYTASITVSPGDAAPLLPAGLLPERAALQLAGTVDVFGRLKGFRDSRGTITLSETRARFDKLDLSATGDVLAHFRGPRVTIDQLELSSTRGDALQLRGVVGSEELDLSLSARGDLWLAPAFFTNVETASGPFTLDLAIAGDFEHASMSGTGRVNRGRLTVAKFDHAIRDLNARLIFRGPDVRLESATAKVGAGEASMKGAISLVGTSPSAYDLQLNYTKVDLRIPSWLPTRTSGQLRFSGDAALPTLSGEVQIHEALYDEDINWERLLPDLRRKVDAPLVFDKSEEDVRFDVHLVAERNIAVRNNLLDVEGKGDLFLVGTEERPGLRGNVSVLGGTATFRNNRYRLTGGNVEFVDSYRISPVFNLTAESRVKDYDIRARVVGPLRDVRVELGSTPQLAEIDILALLTFGFTQYELTDDTATSGIATGLEVVSAYTGLEDEVKRILPGAVSDIAGFNVNELRLTSQFSSSGANVPAVAVGFELDPGIAVLGGSHLRLQSTLIDVSGNGTEQRVEWEKRFENDLRLRFVWRSQDRGACPNCLNEFGDPGMDLWYRWEF